MIARNSSFAYKGKSIDAKQVAQELGVQYLLEGSVRRSAQQIRISAQLVDAASGKQIWAERYDLELADVFAIQDEIAERVAGAIEPELLKTEGAQAAARHTGNMTAWGPCAAGNLALSSGNPRKPPNSTRTVSPGLQARSRFA